MIAILLAALLPSSATCPRGYVLSTGIRPDGSFRCYLWPRDSDRDDVEPVDVRPGRIGCHGGAVPVVVTDHSVGCLRIGAAS